jgi:uncharacterized protein with PIN domain
MAEKPVLKMSEVVSYIKRQDDIILSYDQVGFYRRRLLEVITTSEFDRKQHLENVYRSKDRRDAAVASGKCPRCGGNLMLREGKYGVNGNCECSIFGKIECSVFRNSSTSFSVTMMQHFL